MMMSARTLRYLRRVSTETRRRGIPWVMLIAGAALIGLAVGCAIIAING